MCFAGKRVTLNSVHHPPAADRDGWGARWPIGYEDLSPWYEHVERFLGVHGSAAAIPNLGSGHLKNSEVQPLDVYRLGDVGWRRLDLPAEPLQIRDLREFAAVVRGESPPEFSVEHDLAVQRSLLAGCGLGEGAP